MVNDDKKSNFNVSLYCKTTCNSEIKVIYNLRRRLLMIELYA